MQKNNLRRLFIGNLIGLATAVVIILITEVLFQQFFDNFESLLKKKGISPEDFVDDIQNGGVKYPELYAQHVKATQKMLEQAIAERKFYIPG